MRLPIRVHAEAKRELLQARDYYKDIDRDLAIRLLDEQAVALRYVGGFPEAGSPLFDSYRHVVLPHFPYLVVYMVTDRSVNVLAVFHVRRD
ncbi:MAG: type II toxin-antitoxin system RelE/ParE family toxin, partial [Propionibacteriaceae bacterium]|nr:type II toxin-antitoxin system RelE/ParE family toxin [Propionibacteriaceae bacterium]